MARKKRIKVDPEVLALVYEDIQGMINAEAQKQLHASTVAKVLSASFEGYRLGLYGFDSATNEFVLKEEKNDKS